MDIHTDLVTAVPEMTSLAASGLLENLIEYCIKVHKTAQVLSAFHVTTCVTWLSCDIVLDS